MLKTKEYLLFYEGSLLDFAGRLKLIRSLVEQNRETFAKFINMPLMTLRSWETRKTIPTKSSINKLLDKLTEKDIQVTREWLVDGIGSPPLNVYDDSIKKNSTPDGKKKIILEEKISPLLKKGDVVECELVSDDDVQHQDLIIACENDNYFLGRALYSFDDELFIAPIIDNDISPLKRYHKKRIQLFKIVSFKHS